MSIDGQRLQATPSHKAIVLLALLCFVAFFANNGFLRPDIMETRNLETAREMVEGGNWLVPRMNGEYRLEKPPLPTWIAAAAQAVAPDNLEVQRTMSGLAGCMLVVFFYLFAVKITRRDDYAFIASLMLITCYQIILQARTATWDIYCHAFMMGGIYFLWRGLYEESRIWRNMMLAGIMTGLSFMSKGPVSLYALLLPWIIAVVVMRRPCMKGRKLPLMVMIVLTVAISSWWYVLILTLHPEAAQYVIHKETGSWQNHNVRPWFYYWRFFVETGIWTPLMLLALAFPVWRKKLGLLRSPYTFALLWTAAQLVLLSLMPEKKMRYLLPMMMPCCYTMAFIIIYWCDKSHKKTARKAVVGIAAVFAVAELVAMPVVAKTFSNPDYHSISATKEMAELKGVPFYSNAGEQLRIEIVYAAGRVIRPLDYSSKNINEELRKRMPCVLLSHKNLAEELPEGAFENIDTVFCGKYNNSNRSRFSKHGSDDNFIYNVTLLKPKANGSKQNQ